MGVDSVKSTVTVLEEGWFRLEGVLFYWRISLYVEEEWGHILLLEDQVGVYFDLEEGSSSSEIGGDTLIGRGCI